MFTGIITEIGTVRAVTDSGGGRRLEVAQAFAKPPALGASLAHGGACLTVVARDAGWHAVEVSNETLSRTVLNDWVVGTPLNLERSLKAGDELGGHLVSGHVDGVGEVMSVIADGDSWRVEIRAPKPLHRLVAEKGSIAVDGVSLTVTDVHKDRFRVNLVPHTWNTTTLRLLGEGSWVNLEADMLARYAARWRETA